jgi:hypothetical protein
MMPQGLSALRAIAGAAANHHGSAALETRLEPSQYGENASPAARGLRAGWLDFVVSLAAVALLWSPVLRNDVPGGDGDLARVMKFISFARNAGGFAFWNPYRNGGYPLAADPEHFWLLSLLVDPTSPHANLTLNAAMLSLILLAAVAAWLIGRKLGLRPFWNVLFVVTLSFNERLIWNQLSGREAALLSHAALLAVIWNLLYRPARPWNYALISAAIGVAFAVSGHYAFVHCAVVLSVFLFDDGAPWRRPLRRSLSAFGRAALVCMAGLALSGVWSIPLLAHFAEARPITSTLAYPPDVPDSLLAYARLFVPFVPAGIDYVAGNYAAQIALVREYVSFLSLMLVPAVVLARWARPPAKLARVGLRFDLIYAWGALFVLMPVPLIGPSVKALYQMLPLVSGVRWSSPLEDVVRTAWIIDAFAIFQALERRRVGELDRTTRFLIGAYLALVAAYSAVAGVADRDTVTVAAAVAGAAVATYVLVRGFGVRIVALERATVAHLGGALVVLSIALVASELVGGFYYYPDSADRPVTRMPSYTPNRDLPRLEDIVRGDQDPYFRFMFGGDSQLLFLHDQKRGGLTFSLFYPPSLERTLTYLSPGHETHQLRPHWVQLVSCGDFDPRALDLIGVKYLFCSPNGADEPRLSANWQAVGREQGYVLVRNAAYGGGIRIFCNWRAGGPQWGRDDVLSAFSERVALVEPAAMQKLPAPGADCAGPAHPAGDVIVLEDRPGHMTLKATSATPGIVFIPDNYDSGWRGASNGVATPVIEVYGAYIGLPIQQGENVVSLEYRDNYFWIGLATTAFAAIGVCVYAGFAGRRRTSAAG